MDKAKTTAGRDYFEKVMKNSRKDNLETMRQLKGVDPKYAQHMFDRNRILEDFAFNLFGNVRILDQPVCRSCERPAAWNKGGTAHCFACGADTKKPWTVRQYLLDQLEKQLTPEQVELLKHGGQLK